MEFNVQEYTQNFWKYASSTKGIHTLDGIFTKWAEQKRLSYAICKDVWDSVNSDIAVFFTKEATAKIDFDPETGNVVSIEAGDDEDLDENTDSNAELTTPEKSKYQPDTETEEVLGNEPDNNIVPTLSDTKSKEKKESDDLLSLFAEDEDDTTSTENNKWKAY